MRINNFEYFTFTYLDSPLEKIDDYVQKKLGDSGKYKITRTPFKFDLYERCPPKGGAHFEKLYFFAPKTCEDKCIMFSNYPDGFSSLIYNISDALKIKAYCFQISTNNAPDAMNAFKYIENGKEVRIVYAMKDPKWNFYCHGEIQPFEDKELYQRKMIKRRLDKEALISYCAKLGIDILDDAFWESQQSVLVERLSW